MQEARTGSVLGVSALSRASAIIADSPTGWPDARPRRYWIPERTAGSCCSCCAREGVCAAEITPSTARKASSERDPVRDMARVLLERNRHGNESRPVTLDCTAAQADFEPSHGRFPGPFHCRIGVNSSSIALSGWHMSWRVAAARPDLPEMREHVDDRVSQQRHGLPRHRFPTLLAGLAGQEVIAGNRGEFPADDRNRDPLAGCEGLVRPV